MEGARTVLDTDATGAVQDTTDKILYADTFDYTAKTVPVIGAGGEITGTEAYIASRGGAQSVIPRYTSDRNGAFEAYLPSGSDNYVLRQQVDQAAMGLGGTWNNGNPITAIGDNRWLNYKASVDVSFENNSTQSGNNYAAIGARQQGGGNSHYTNGTPYFLKFTFDGGWQLLVDGTAVSSGNVVSGTGGVTIAGFKAAYGEWHNLALQVVENKVTAYLDGTQLATYTDASPRLSGRVDLASGYYYTRFDNLKVETVDGLSPVLLRAARQSGDHRSGVAAGGQAGLRRLVVPQERPEHVQLPALPVLRRNRRHPEVHLHGNRTRHPGTQRRLGQAGGHGGRTGRHGFGQHGRRERALPDLHAPRAQQWLAHRPGQGPERHLGRGRRGGRRSADLRWPGLRLRAGQADVTEIDA